MLFGIDFDNTIVCYDKLFHQLALERSLIPPDLPADKETVRDYLRQSDREDAWTELQGYAYGPRIQEAVPFPGVKDFFLRCRETGIPVCVVSHKTRKPVRGPDVDLHHAARAWLEVQGFLDDPGIALPTNCIFFEEAKEQKLQRIVDEGCSHFIDDLPEFLGLPGFPEHVERVLFDPWNRHVGKVSFERVSSWSVLRATLLGENSK
jgi:hypothetical protein